MRFADPEACPACQGRLDGSPTCPSCGLDLTSPEVVELWQTLLHADALVARAVAARDAAPHGEPVAPPGQPSATTEPPQPSAPPTYPAPGASYAGPGFPSPLPPLGARPERSWSVGTVLPALGAAGLVVAALIFVSRSWDTLGLAGKATIMLAATVLVGVAAGWVTRRPLRASAEALWAVKRHARRRGPGWSDSDLLDLDLAGRQRNRSTA